MYYYIFHDITPTYFPTILRLYNPLKSYCHCKVPAKLDSEHLKFQLSLLVLFGILCYLTMAYSNQNKL